MNWLNRHRAIIAWVILIVILAYIWAGQQNDTDKVKKTAAAAAETATALKATVSRLDDTVKTLNEALANIKRLDSKVTTATCKKINKLQTNLVNFLTDSTVRSKRNANAILQSPFSTKEEKTAAAKNLKQIEQFLKDFKAKFPNAKCSSAVGSSP